MFCALALGSMIAIYLIYHKIPDIREDVADGRKALVKYAFEEVEPKTKNPKKDDVSYLNLVCFC